MFLYFLSPSKCGLHHCLHAWTTNCHLTASSTMHWCCFVKVIQTSAVAKIRSHFSFLVLCDLYCCLIYINPQLMSLLVSMVCSVVTFFFFTTFFSSFPLNTDIPPKSPEDPKLNPLMVAPFHITLASTPVTFKSPVLIPTLLWNFRHWLPTAK